MSFGIRRILPSIIRDGESGGEGEGGGDCPEVTSSDSINFTLVHTIEQELLTPKEADTIVSVTPAP